MRNVQRKVTPGRSDSCPCVRDVPGELLPNVLSHGRGHVPLPFLISSFINNKPMIDGLMRKMKACEKDVRQTGAIPTRHDYNNQPDG